MKPIEYLCTVRSFRMITPTVFETAFETNQPLTFKAGQFASVVVPGAGPKGRDLRRAYSIASAPEQSPIELCVKLVEEGPGTNFLHKLRPGDQFKAFAPYGDFLYEPKKDRYACFIATGTGIAPFRSMILSQEFQDHPPKEAMCFLGVRFDNEVLYQDSLGNLPKLRYQVAVSQPTDAWKGYRGRVTDLLRGYNHDFPWLETEYYLCGHGGMINEIKAHLFEKGVSKDSVHQEIYYK